MFTPRKDVPIPRIARPTLKNRRKYPLDTMEIGAFFFVPGKTNNILSTHVSTTGKRLGRKFATRLVHAKETLEGWELCKPAEAGAVRGIGVWRIE